MTYSIAINKMWKYVILVGTFLITSCKKNSECDFNGPYEFQLPVALAPATDTLHVGDTIFVESRFSNMVFERKTQRAYKLENFSFYPTTAIQNVGINPAVSGIYDFELLIDTTFNYQIQNFSSGSSYLTGEYDYTGTEYILNFRFICKKKGLYYFNHNTFLVSGPGEDQDFPGKCDGKRVHSYSTTNNEVNSNMDLLRESPDPLYNDIIFQKPQQRFYDNGGYVFYVVE